MVSRPLCWALHGCCSNIAVALPQFFFLAFLISSFADHLGDIPNTLLEPVLGLLRHPSKEVLKAVLGFIKVTLKSVDASITRVHLPIMVCLAWNTNLFHIRSLVSRFLVG